ncbi:MAG TPA: hypothetical protein PLR06_06530 [Cyclobacteriaceae bacterium]|nr:hypothetical protein [Cyclobacteriaceae bacterium]
MTHVDNVKSVLIEIETISDLDDYAYERILLAMTKVKQLPIFIDQIQAGREICRTRSHENNELFKGHFQIKNPGKELVDKYARCNRPYQSVFYSSENRPTSYMELIENWAESAKFGDRFYATIGLWELKADLDVVVILNSDKSKRTTDFEKYFGEHIDERLATFEPDLRESSTLFLNYIDEKFSKQAKKDLKTYLITTAYSNLALLHANGTAQGIIYQSVPFAKKGINIAIQPPFVKNLDLKYVLRDGFEAFENELGKHSFMQFESIQAKEVDNHLGLIEW